MTKLPMRRSATRGRPQLDSDRFLLDSRHCSESVEEVYKERNPSSTPEW